MAPAENQLTAKTKMVTDYLLLAQAMHNAADSMNAYVAVLAGTDTHANTVSLLIPPPQLPPLNPYNGHYHGMPVGQGSAVPRQQAKQATPEEPESKKRVRKEKKEKDPNAPKRPASGYIVYQNHIRPILKEAHPEMPHKDLQAKISADWANMEAGEKKRYTEEATKALDDWKRDTEAYKATDEYRAAHPDEKPKTKKASKAKADAVVAAPAAEESGEDETDDDDSDAAAAVVPKKVASPDSDEDESSEEDEQPAPKKSKKAASPPKSSTKKVSKTPAKAGRKSKA